MIARFYSTSKSVYLHIEVNSQYILIIFSSSLLQGYGWDSYCRWVHTALKAGSATVTRVEVTMSAALAGITKGASCGSVLG